MSFNEQAFQLLNQRFSFLSEHFLKVNEKIHLNSDRVLQEVKVFDKFAADIASSTSSYEKSLFRICEDFQHDIKLTVQNEKLLQLFQLAINSVLHHANSLQQKFENLVKVRKSLDQIEKDFAIAINNTTESIASNLSYFRSKQKDYEILYKRSIRKAYAAVMAPTLEKERSRSGSGDSWADGEEESRARESFTDLETLIQFNISSMKKRSSECFEKETEVKARLKGSIGQFISILIPSSNEEEFRRRAVDIDLSDSSRQGFFESMEEESSLEFNRLPSMSREESRFTPLASFARLDTIFDSQAMRSLFDRVQLLGRKISPKVRLYIDLLLEAVYTSNQELSAETRDEVNMIMANDKTSEYLIYLLILKKSQLFLEKPLGNLILRKEQIRNLMTFTHSFFLNCLSGKALNVEAVINIFKLCMSIFNEQKGSFIEHLSKMPVLHDLSFWYNVLQFLQQQYKVNGSGESSESSGVLLSGMKQLVGTLKTSLNPPIKSSSSSKAFEDVSYFLFKLKLDFETITDILLFLAPKAGFPLEGVRLMLQRNQDLFLAQISGGSGIFGELRRTIGKNGKPMTREQKLVLVLKRTLDFFDSPAELREILLINKIAAANRTRFALKTLGTLDLRAHLGFRRWAMRMRFEPQLQKSALAICPPHEYDSIISLDVKRTYCDDPIFDSVELENVLKNLASPEMGNFSYYQGLNYLASYFYMSFKGDALAAYNMVISLMNKDFSSYVDGDLRNLRKLFFYLKRLIRIYLPAVANYLENDQKLDTDIVFASWCLTLFTTVTQYHLHSDYLDEIVDIFLNKSWAGFFRVVMVILESLQNKIITLSYEEILVLLTDLPKTDFAEVIKQSGLAEEPSKRFSFKDRIRQYSCINKDLLVYIQLEYHSIQEKIDQFWHNINRKTKN